MSRSIKKYGIVKDKGLSRGLYNRRFRRVNKQRVRLGREPFLMREVVNDYEVCDYILSWTEPLDTKESVSKEFRKHMARKRRFYFGK